MIRAVLTIAAVAILSYCVARLEYARGQRAFPAEGQRLSWVRTVDGWEPSAVLSIEPRSPVDPPLHPLLVASFQLTASLFALLAFPTTNLRVVETAARGGPSSTGGKARQLQFWG